MVILHCISMSPPQWWKVSEDGIIDIIGYTIEIYLLKLPHASASQSGRYYCNGTKLNGVNFVSHGDVYIAGNQYITHFAQMGE